MLAQSEVLRNGENVGNKCNSPRGKRNGGETSATPKAWVYETEQQ
jgi:hypothetical protein